MEVLGDSGYGSGPTRAALRTAGHTQTTKPIPLHSAVPGGFTIHDFRIDTQAGMARRPAGATAPVTSSGRVSFARHGQGARCAGAAPPPRVATPSASTPTRTSCGPPGAGR